ncbi:MAG: DUF4442 domain-containing protein [Saprospirales bacterium]|nr:DUF4442 domain-containing protein [Saprospirales bacterium]
MAQLALNRVRDSYIRTLHAPWKMRLYFLRYLPSALFWGLRIAKVSPEQCAIRIPFSWRTQNPFRSIYFAAQAGAAEMSTGLLAIIALQGKPPLSMLVIDIRIEYVKKARGTAFFTCEDGKAMEQAILQALETGEGQSLTATSIGRLESGEEVTRAYITWSFKPKVEAFSGERK